MGFTAFLEILCSGLEEQRNDARFVCDSSTRAFSCLYVVFHLFWLSHALRRAPICVPTKPHQASSFSCAVPVSLSPDKLPSGFFCSWDLSQHNFHSLQSSSTIGVKPTCTSWRFVLRCGRRKKNPFSFSILFLSSSQALVEIGVVNKFLSLHSGEAYRVTEWIWIMLMKEFFSFLPPFISKRWTLKILDWVCVSSDASLFSRSILVFCKKRSGFLTWRNVCELEVHLIIFLMCVGFVCVC